MKALAITAIAASVLLVSCGEEKSAEPSAAPAQTAVSDAKPAAEASVADSPEKKAAAVAALGADSPEKAAQAYLDAVYDCDYDAAFSYVEGGTQLLADTRKQLADAHEQMKQAKEMMGAAANMVDSANNLTGGQENAVRSAVGTMDAALPESLEAVCKEAMKNWTGPKPKLDGIKVSESGNSATLSMTVVEAGKMMEEVAKMVKVGDKWFVDSEGLDIGGESSQDAQGSQTQGTQTRGVQVGNVNVSGSEVSVGSDVKMEMGSDSDMKMDMDGDEAETE